MTAMMITIATAAIYWVLTKYFIKNIISFNLHKDPGILVIFIIFYR